MKKQLLFITIVLVLLLSSCGGSDELVYNFEARKDNTLFSEDGRVIIDYKTDNNGELIAINIDRLLTIEEMILLHPSIDFEYEIEGFTGDIFITPQGQCTEISNDLLVPVNIEIGNTRYKFDNIDCMYKTVDSNNLFRPGFAAEYHLTDTILEDKNVTISIIVYQPDELVKFVEIYQLPHTYELLGVYHLLPNEERSELTQLGMNYYYDVGTYEQLYLKHQNNEDTLSEIDGFPEEINLLDLSSLTDITPLIENFRIIYQAEITAVDELQDLIGVNFDISEEEPEEEGEEPTEE